MNYKRLFSVYLGETIARADAGNNNRARQSGRRRWETINTRGAALPRNLEEIPMRQMVARAHAAPAVPRGLVIVGAASASWIAVAAAGVAVTQMFTWLVSTL